RDGTNRCIGQHVFEGRNCAAVLTAKRLRCRSVLINDGGKGFEPGEITDDVLAPVASTNGGDFRPVRCGGGGGDCGGLGNDHPARFSPCPSDGREVTPSSPSRSSRQTVRKRFARQ